jgi:hypothetical protein
MEMNVLGNPSPTRKALLGIYATRAGAEEGFRVLRTSGFGSEEISVLYPENFDSKEVAQAKSDRAQAGAIVGGGSGMVAGGTMGLLAGLVALAIPGAGPFLVAGPLLGALAGAGVGGVVGEVAGALVGMGLSDAGAKQYESRIRKGAILLSIHSADELSLARADAILRQTGAEDVVMAHEGRIAQSAETNRRHVA